MKQYIYNAETIKRNFLAGYADAILKENRLFFVNVLTDRQVLLEGNNSLLAKLVDGLQNGISDAELNSLLSELGMQDLLEVLMREGLIE
jgi:hypothetical protein